MKLLKLPMDNVCIIGDIHSSPNELETIISKASSIGVDYFISLGDIIDRGYDVNKVISILYDLYKSTKIEIIMGNHDWKLYRYLNKRNVTPGEHLSKTLSYITEESKIKFLELFDQQTFGIFDYSKKIFCSHAAAGRPQRLLEICYSDFKTQTAYFDDFSTFIKDKIYIDVPKNIGTLMLFGKTNGDTKDGKPVRLPITTDINDDLDEWTYIFGHIHASNLYPEGNERIICLDFCCGEPDGILAATIFKDGKRFQIFSNEGK